MTEKWYSSNLWLHRLELLQTENYLREPCMMVQILLSLPRLSLVKDLIQKLSEE